MANRTFSEFANQGLIKKVVTLYPVISVAAAGAVTLKKRLYSAGGATSLASSTSLGNAPTSGVGYVVGDGAGTATVVRTGTGAWTITLSDSYQYLLSVEIINTQNATGLLTANSLGVKTTGTNVTTNTSTGSGGTIAVVLNNVSGSAADPANGDILTLSIVLGDATEP